MKVPLPRIFAPAKGGHEFVTYCSAAALSFKSCLSCFCAILLSSSTVAAAIAGATFPPVYE